MNNATRDEIVFITILVLGLLSWAADYFGYLSR